MPSDSPIVLCQDTLIRLREEVVLANGASIPAGTLVLLLPQTVADCVLTPDGTSLAEAWGGLSREGHAHSEIIALSEQLTRYADRLARVEMEMARLSALNPEKAITR